jgi:hypothetical protein
LTTTGTALATVALLVDYWPAPQGLVELRTPGVYRTLAQQPPGAVLEVPFGIRDGSGELGRFDPWRPYYQTDHGHAEVGGFVARLPEQVKTAHLSDPILGPILRMSELTPIDPDQIVCRQSLACAVRYVVIDDASAPPRLRQFVRSVFGLRLVERIDEKSLFAVDRLDRCSCR